MLSSTNQAVAFATNDGMVGYYATDNAGLCAEFEKHMRANRFGISEIPQAEYEAEFVQKKTGEMLRPLAREEFSGSRNLARLMASGSELEKQSAAVAVAKDTIQRKPGDVTAPSPVPHPSPAPVPEMSAMAAATPKDTAPAPEKPDFQPNVGKRKRGLRRALPPDV